MILERSTRLVMIGVNDVWRHFDNILTQAGQVEEEEFTQIYEELIQETLTYTKGMIIAKAVLDTVGFEWN